MNIEDLFLLVVTIFIIGAISALLTYKNAKLSNYLSSSFATMGSILGLIFSITIFLTNSPLSINLLTSFPLLNISISIDMLSAFFIFIISLVATCCSIYGFGYMQKYLKSYNLGSFGFFYNLFILSMILVVSANNGLYFLLVWEIMSLTSYFLIIFENKIRENIQAGLLYLIMTHFGTLLILLSFIFLYTSTGSFDFNFIRAHASNIPLMTKNIVFVLALIGFGTKAGIIPLHIWLPRAHPAAPSQVSALMSGVMIKTAIFMFIKLFIDILPSSQLWWGPMIIIIGAISSLLGVLNALSEHDIKKLLAYHSIENIGIILMGLGSAVTFYSLHMNALAILGLVAALYHTLNHAIFKSLLFLGAGSLIYQTHTRNIEEYGGLIKKMPYTAFFFLIGSMAISALPPFNGFASEWLTFQSLFIGLTSHGTIIKVCFVTAITSLAFTGGLAAACFVKAFAVTFLAKPRSKVSENAKESPLSMNFGMSILAVLCLLFGIFAGFITSSLVSISKSITSLQNSNSIILSQPEQISINSKFATLNLPLVFLALSVTFLLVFTLVYLKTRKRKENIVQTWDCGAPSVTARSEITSTGFARSLITMFEGILKPSKQSNIEYSDADADNRYFPSSKTVILEVPNLYEQQIYRPIQKIIVFVSNKFAVIQNGNVNLYLLYMFVTLVGLLIWARI